MVVVLPVPLTPMKEMMTGFGVAAHVLVEVQRVDVQDLRNGVDERVFGDVARRV